MARLEDLITTVEDDALREALAHEVRALKHRVPFGLVFERHLPEYVLLPASAGVSVGDRVRLRENAADQHELRVLRRSGDQVTFVDETGQEGEASLNDVLVVRGMGEPVLEWTPFFGHLGACGASRSPC